MFSFLECSSSIEVLERFSPQSSISSVEVLDRFSRQSNRKHSDEIRNLLQTQLYVQQQFNQSNEGSDASLSFDVLVKSTSNSDIEEILDDPLDNDGKRNHITITETDGKTLTLTDCVANEECSLKLKKPLLTGMNLTESSSSGSVTDSICTAYENNPIETLKSSEQSTSMSSNTTSSTVIASPMPELDTNTPKKSLPLNESDLNKTEDTSALSNIIGGEYKTYNEPLKTKYFLYSFCFDNRIIPLDNKQTIAARNKTEVKRTPMRTVYILV